MASPEATTRTNHGQMTPESTPGPDADRLAADKERQKTQAAPTSHGLATPDATPEPDELRIQADKARQQQAEHADPKEAPSTQSKPPFDAESASESQVFICLQTFKQLLHNLTRRIFSNRYVCLKPKFVQILAR